MSFSNRILKGAAILTMSRIVARTFSLVTTLTVARWLGPDEMGVFGVTMLVLAALEQLSESGLRTALIQSQGDIGRYVVAVRTVQAVRGLCLGLLVFLTAPWTSELFHSPRSLEMLRVLALVPVIQGLEPIFETLARRELNYGSIARVQLASGAVALIVGVAAAILNPSAWALVYSAISRSVVNTLGYYWVSEHKHLGMTLRWAPLRDLRSFGFWVFANGVISYSFVRVGEWMIGSMLSVRDLALYQMALLISTAATAELGSVVSNMMLPVFSRLQDERDALEAAFGFSFGVVSLVTFLVAALVCACAPDLYRLVLGEGWTSSLSLVPWLVVWGVCSVFAGAIATLLQALGRPKLWAQTVLAMLVLMVIGVYPMTRWLGATGVAVLLAFIGTVMQLFRYWLVAKLIRRTYAQVLGHILVPMVACVTAVFLVRGIIGAISDISAWASLTLSATGTIVVFALITASSGTWLQPSLSQLIDRLRSSYNSALIHRGTG